MSYPKEILDAGHAILSRRREAARTALRPPGEIAHGFAHVMGFRA